MNKISNEYAKALFMLSAEDGAQDEVYDALCTVRTVFSKNPDYPLLLCCPSISVSERLSALDMALGGRINEAVVSFLKLLTEKSRIGLFYDCVKDFERLYNASRGVMPVKVTSAVELTDSEKEKIKNALEKKHGLAIELSCYVDKDILGGIIIEAEDTVIDGSLKGRLSDIKEAIRA